MSVIEYLSRSFWSVKCFEGMEIGTQKRHIFRKVEYSKRDEGTCLLSAPYMPFPVWNINSISPSHLDRLLVVASGLA